MKHYQVYRNIRKQAMIFGLPLTFFALQMISIIGSLLVIIFSFGWVSIVVALVWNPLLYVVLTKVAHRPDWYQLGIPFPNYVSNKQNSFLRYERD